MDENKIDEMIANHKIMAQRLDSLFDDYKKIHEKIHEQDLSIDRLSAWYEKKEGISL